MNTPLKSEDLYLFNEGSHHKSYLKMGAHPHPQGGVWFSVWAPAARKVTVAGDFNDWNLAHNPLQVLDSSGVWTGYVRGARIGQNYKFIVTTPRGEVLEKADPYAFYTESPPRTASRICSLEYQWQDADWMNRRKSLQATDQALAIYEIHLGSWKKKLEEQGRPLTYRELAEELPNYLKNMNFTHVEMMPVMEHPFYGSWGYQTTGYFAPTSRYGTPQDFMSLVDSLHQHGLGVILDWVPSHFPGDVFSLARFDGTALFEHEDPKLGFHPDWNSLIFNYGRHEVKSFLISSALFWLDKYHIDGLRVDAVASMLYLDYSRKSGEWIPNRFGGRENLEAIEFLKDLNRAIYHHFPDVHTIAEESTAWPKVSAPTYAGGLGFGMKWDMGWMHDTLEYFRRDSIHRRFHQNQLSFRMMYAFQENFVLSLSHDEVVYGKGSLYQKMSGDEWQKFANLRALYAYMYAMPGKKLLFMGCEFAQREEWHHERSLDWHLLQLPAHQGIQNLVRDLNGLYKKHTSLHVLDFDGAGFQWLDASDHNNSVYSFFRHDDQGNTTLCLFNLTPVPRPNYRLGVAKEGRWCEVLNTDSFKYGGSGMDNPKILAAQAGPSHGHPYYLCVNLPPLAALYLQWEGMHGT